MESAIQFSEIYFHSMQVLYFVDESHSSWFRSVDIGNILQIQKLDKVVGDYVPAKYTKFLKNIIFINEHGLFALIMKSKCPVTAEQFGFWMFEDVLPLIKTEEYKRTQQIFEAEIAHVNARCAVLESSNIQLQLEIQDLNRRYDEQQRKMDVIKDQRVVPTVDRRKRNCLEIFKKNQDVLFPYFALRVQNCQVKPRVRQERRKYPQMERIFATSSPNSINLFNRVKATRMFGFKNDSHDYNSFRIADSVEKLISYIKDVHDQRLKD